MAYSEVTDRLQLSHDQLKAQVQSLREELSEKNRLLERKNRRAIPVKTEWAVHR